MEIYYIVIIILLIFLVAFLVYKNKLLPTTQSPQIIYLKEKPQEKPNINNLGYSPLGNLNYDRYGRLINRNIIGNPILPPPSPANKIGILVSEAPSGVGKEVMNLYIIIVDAWREIFSYYAEDKNGFQIPLNNKYNYKLVTGEIINDIPSKPGKWSVLLY